MRRFGRRGVPLPAAALICLAIALGGCSAKPLTTARVSFGPIGGDVSLPVVSVTQRKFATIVRQQYDFSCGSAAMATLLSFHYADPQPESAVFLGMWREGDQPQIRKTGFSLLDMKRYLQQRGMDGNGYRVGLDQIAETGIPGIAMIETNGYRHFVVVKGVHGNEVLVGDPSLGIRTMTAADFAKAWNGVYFVVERTQGPAPRFGHLADWKLINRARFVGAMDLESLQAASLLAVGFQEF